MTNAVSSCHRTACGSARLPLLQHTSAAVDRPAKTAANSAGVFRSKIGGYQRVCSSENFVRKEFFFGRGEKLQRNAKSQKFDFERSLSRSRKKTVRRFLGIVSGKESHVSMLGSLVQAC